MAVATVGNVDKARARPRKYGSMSRDRRWALRWSYFFLVIFAIFFLVPPVYMVITSLKTSAEISAEIQSVVGVSPDAVELRRAADVALVSDIFPQLGGCLRGGGHDHHADQRARRLRSVAHEILGFGDTRHRRLPHLPDPGDAAVPAALQDVRHHQRADGHPADQQLVGAADPLSDADGAVLHLDHDRLLRLDPQGARRGRPDRRRRLFPDARPRSSFPWRCRV